MDYLKTLLRSPRVWQTLVAYVGSDRILDALVALGLREVSE